MRWREKVLRVIGGAYRREGRANLFSGVGRR
jgi:hypothetical protein